MHRHTAINNQALPGNEIGFVGSQVNRSTGQIGRLLTSFDGLHDVVNHV